MDPFGSNNTRPIIALTGVIAAVALLVGTGCETLSDVAGTVDDGNGAVGGGGGGIGAGTSAPAATNAPEDLTCDDYYESSHLHQQFPVLYCDDTAQFVAEHGGDAKVDATSVARTTLRNAMKTTGVNMKERWQAAYVHLCATELEEVDTYYPNMTLTCKWHADKLDYDVLFKQEDWMSSALQKHVKQHLQQDQQTIQKMAKQEFPPDKSKRQREVYYELRDNVWQAYVAQRQENASYYDAVDTFKQEARKGNIEECAEPLRSKLTSYVNAGPDTTKKTVLTRVADSVGYALTESLARCHWYHDRTFKTGTYLRLLRGKRREVNFGERLYYAQIKELRKDAKKAEKMPQLEGKSLVTLDPDELNPPDLFEMNEAEQRWQNEGYDFADDIDFKNGVVERVSSSGSGVTLHFPEHEVEVPQRECEETGKIDRITRSGEVIYETVCRTVGYETATRQLPDLKLDGDYGVSAGDWVRIAYDMGSDRSALYIAAGENAEDAQVIRVLDLPIE
jgi:hypothetical protein